MFPDIWNNDAWSSVQMTNAIQEQEYRSSVFSTEIDWSETPITGREVAIEVVKGTVRVLPILGADEPAPAAVRTKGEAIKIPLVRIAEQDTVRNAETLGFVRLAGTQLQASIEALRNDRLQRMLTNILVTRDYHRAKALDGKLIDADGSVRMDFFAIMGKQQIVHDIDLTDNNLDVNDELVALKEISEEELGDFSGLISGYKLLTGKRANAKLRKHDKVKDAFRDPLNLVFLREDNRNGILLADDVEVRSVGRPQWNGRGFLDEGADLDYGYGYLVPDMPDFAVTHFGQSEHADFIGGPSQDVYVYEDETVRLSKKGLGMEAESWHINYFRRPRSIIKIRFKVR